MVKLYDVNRKKKHIKCVANKVHSLSSKQGTTAVFHIVCTVCMHYLNLPAALVALAMAKGCA